jgi:type II secretory pathway component GspD/PulD (secretin)
MKRSLFLLPALCATLSLALDAAVAPSDTLYEIEAKVISFPAGALGTNTLTVTSDSTTVSTSGVWTVGGNVTPTGEGLLKRLESLPGVDLLSAPRVVTRAGQEAKISIGRQIAYLVPVTNTLYRVRQHRFSDDQVEAFSNGLYRMQALDEEQNPGISIAVTVAPAGTSGVKTDVKFRYNLLAEMSPLPGTRIRMGAPVIQSRKIDSTIVAKLGDWAALGGAQRVFNKVLVQDRFFVFSNTRETQVEENIMVFLRVTEAKESPANADTTTKQSF